MQYPHDTEPIVIRKSNPKPKAVKNDAQLAQAMQSGLEVESKKKGKQVETAVSKKQLEDDTGDAPMKIPTITREQGLAIQRARCDQKLTQAQLAQRINEPVKIINEYETGSGVPSNKVLSKLERTLGIKLRGL
ncbi:MAG: putative transcriptional coactivator multiprotein bridging factor [Streblomastix strix]|uniref:Putative transcriptional coactivator multiprotein bridging factor n=1 Tax=Streblomastix strix TaxID=222440 RepID=A0A5J4X9W2_9EUKA|nr:MAG: putative transcriptional coactivator multiprotein bridging factor [Streblomastix strix]